MAQVHERWEFAIAPSDDGFQQFSFVNSIATTKGGTHVDHVANQVVDKLLEVMKKKHKGMDKLLKPNNVKAHMKVRGYYLFHPPVLFIVALRLSSITKPGSGRSSSMWRLPTPRICHAFTLHVT